MHDHHKPVFIFHEMLGLSVQSVVYPAGWAGQKILQTLNSLAASMVVVSKKCVSYVVLEL